MYIVNKQCEPCPVHCKLGTTCYKSNGWCDYGCETQRNCDFCPSVEFSFSWYLFNSNCKYYVQKILD